MRYGLLVMVVIALCAACGGDIATLPAAPTSPASPPASAAVYQGVWTGQTHQSERFGFVVTANQVTRLDFNVSYTDASCIGGLSSGALGPLASISNAEFSGTYTSPSGDLTWSIAGLFVSATSATGTLQVTATHVNHTGPASCLPSVRVTWTAQKAPEQH